MAIRLFDLFSEDDYSDARAQGLIAVRESGDGQFIHNYSDAAIYTPGAWDNPAVRACRGIITDTNDVVIARPWAKFFNHGQSEAGELDLAAMVQVTDKKDGSLGILHRAPNGTLRIATRGSFHSEQAIHATHVLNDRYVREREAYIGSAPDWLTALFEIVYPENRIVLDYGGLDDLILLGGVNIATGAYYGPEAVRGVIGWRGPVTEVFGYDNLLDAIAAPPRPNAEGLCVRYVTRNHIVKIKQDDYVALHRIVTGLSERTVWEHLSDGKPLEDLLGPLPDELHDWTRSVWTRLSDDTEQIAAAADEAHAHITATLSMTGEDWSRKEFALLARSPLYVALAPYLFQILDGRDPRPSILKTLKPAGNTRARPVSEAVA